MSGRIMTFIVTMLMTLLCISCEHRELLDPDNRHYVRIYLDEDIKNVTCGFYDPDLERPEYKSPEIFRAMLASPETGEIVSERYLSNSGCDEKGRYIDGYLIAPAGTYDFLAYQLGSNVTLIENEKDFYGMEAYTMPISERLLGYLPATREDLDENLIVNQPDHLFHSVHEQIDVRRSTEPDTLRTASGDFFSAHSMAKSYYLQIRVKGFEHIRTAVSLMSGMAGSVPVRCHEAFDPADSVHVFFGMKYTGRERLPRSGSTAATLYATFNTFGKIPDIKSIYSISFEFSLSDGSTQVEKIDITDMFDTPEVKDKQWILLEHEIEIKPPAGDGQSGGLSPGVEGWEDIKSEIIM